MARQFDLSAMMSVVSDLDTTVSSHQVQMIPLEDILDNKANFYKVDKSALGDLANSIAMSGLQQYPVVMPHPQKSGKYLLLSGHRRCAALRLLAEDGEHPRPDLRLVPCTVRQYESEAMAELQLIFANSTTRTLSNAELSKQAERLEELLYQLKEEGYSFPGRMRDQVAAACRVSAPKLARLKVIREKLKAPEFLYLFEKDRLREQTAYALARLPEDFQRRLAVINPDLSGNAAELILKKYEEGWRWEPELTCPDGKPCKRGNSFLRHDSECSSYMCGGKTCCLDCEQAKRSCAPCSRMCSKAQALRKEIRDDEKAKENKLALKRARQCQKETQINATRIIRAAEAAGLSDDTPIPWGYDPDRTVEAIRKYAAGEFPEERWYQPRYSPGRLHHPAETAEVLRCSTDYLLGLTDDLTPAAGMDFAENKPECSAVELPNPVWLPGCPDRSRKVVARFVSERLEPWITVCYFYAAASEYRLSDKGVRIDEECTGWWPVPEDEAHGADAPDEGEACD